MNVFVMVIAGLIFIADLEGRRIPYPQNKCVIFGRSTELIWSLEADDLDVIIYKNQNIIIEDKGKYNIEQRYTKNGPVTVLTILNTTLEDTGLYSRQLKLTPERRQNVSIHLSVLDFTWLNTSTVLNLHVGDDATLMWKYVTTSNTTNMDEDISIGRRQISTQDVENDYYRDKWDDSRVQLNITESDDGRTEIVMLTIHNTTIDDFNYIYNMKIQFNNTCVKHAEPVSLIEVPRVSSELPEMIGPPTEDVKFVWHYYYRSPATSVVFSRHTSGQYQEIGYWNGTRLYSYIEEASVQFSNTSDSYLKTITLTIKNTTADDFNTTFGCNITFNDGLTGYGETKLLCDPVADPQLGTVPNLLHGKIGDNVTLYWEYTYCSKATDIRFFRIYGSGQLFPIGRWTKNGGYQPKGKNRAEVGTVEGKEKITLVILNTDQNDYNSNYTCEVTFEDISRNLTAIELILIPDTGISGITEENKELYFIGVVVTLIILNVLSTVLGVISCRRKKQTKKPTSASLSYEYPRPVDTIPREVDENIPFCTKLCWSGEYTIPEYSEYSSDDISQSSQCDNLGTYV